jgi:hypothetical protein
MNASIHALSSCRARPARGGLPAFMAAVLLASACAGVLVQAGADRPPGSDQLAEETAVLLRVWTIAQTDAAAE